MKEKNRKWELLEEDDEIGISLLDDSEALSEPPRVYIKLEAMKKIQYFVKLASGEINGWGWVEKRGNNFVITNAFILKQKASAASVEEDPLALNQLVAECDDPTKLRFQWHSHGDILVFFSGEDRATIRRHPTDFMISFCINKKGEYSCRLDLYKPFYAGFKVPLWVILPVEEELLNYCRTEIENKVEEGGFSLRKRLPSIVQRALNLKDNRFSDYDEETDPIAIPLEDLSSQEGE